MFFHLKHGLMLPLHPFHHHAALHAPAHLFILLHHAHTHPRHPLLLHAAHLVILFHGTGPGLLHTAHLVILHHRAGLRRLRPRGPRRDQYYGRRYRPRTRHTIHARSSFFREGCSTHPIRSVKLPQHRLLHCILPQNRCIWSDNLKNAELHPIIAGPPPRFIDSPIVNAHGLASDHCFLSSTGIA